MLLPRKLVHQFLTIYSPGGGVTLLYLIDIKYNNVSLSIDTCSGFDQFTNEDDIWYHVIILFILE